MLEKLNTQSYFKSIDNLPKVDESKEEYKPISKKRKSFSIRKSFTFSDKFEDCLYNKNNLLTFSSDHNKYDIFDKKRSLSVRPIKEVLSKPIYILIKRKK